MSQKFGSVKEPAEKIVQEHPPCYAQAVFGGGKDQDRASRLRK